MKLILCCFAAKIVKLMDIVIHPKTKEHKYRQAKRD